MSIVTQVLALLASAVIAVPIAKRLGLSAVLGYLFAGVIIGPSGLALLGDLESAMKLAEFGVVFLLFLIGLELNPSRLWLMRKTVFALGGSQVLLTTAVLTLVVAVSTDLAWIAAGLVGVALSLSSTAFVMPLLAEKRQLQTAHGQTAFAVLLFQDLAVIPLLAALPLLGENAAPAAGNGWILAGKVAIVFGGLVVAGRFLVRPLFRAIASSGNNEVLTATALLIVVGTAELMEAVGLPMSLGAFLAGVLLAESEFRHELQADIEPFKGLLLGLFFMTVGMQTNIALLREWPLTILSMALGFMVAKTLVVFLLGRAARLTLASARAMAFALPQGGEFAFVLFGLAAGYGVMSRAYADMFTVVVTLSMVLTPLFFLMNERVLSPWLDGSNPRPFDEIQSSDNAVIIAGIGRFGQIVARVLRTRKIPFTALDHNAEHVDFLRRFGTKLHYGDATRLELLRAANADKAKIFVLAIDDVLASVQAAELVHRHFPNLEIYARARNRQHAYQLMSLGVNVVVRETFHSSLALAETVLRGLGMSEEDARYTVERFGEYDETLVKTNYQNKDDVQALIQTGKQAAEELESLFTTDAAR